jgi:ABC-type glycerol-3-phosphate transport system substrate-binding protein
MTTRSDSKARAAACAGWLAATLFSTGAAMAAPPQVVRFLQNETDPPSIAFYNQAIAEFEKENPGIKVEMESVSTDSRLQKVTAALRARTMPEVFKLLSEERVDFARKGYLVPLDGIVDAIGEKDFVDGTIHRVDGKVYDIPYTLNNFNVLFYRSDLLKAANVTPPRNWDELLAAAKTLTQGDTQGFIFPAGQNRMNSLAFASLVWSAGGTFFDKNLKVTFDNPATIKALQFLKSLTPYVPKGVASYSYSDMINVYLTGKIAMDVYAPRLIATAYSTVPDLAAKTSVAPTPRGPSGIGVEFISPNSYAIASPKVGAKNTEAALKFLKFIVTGDRLKDFSLTAYPHMIPPLKSVQAAVIAAGTPKMGGREDIGKVAFDLTNSLDFEDEAGATFVDGKVVKTGIDNPYIGAIVARGIPAQVVQRVVINGEDPAKAAAWGQKRMEEIVDDLKSSSK